MLDGEPHHVYHTTLLRMSTDESRILRHSYRSLFGHGRAFNGIETPKAEEVVKQLVEASKLTQGTGHPNLHKTAPLPGEPFQLSSSFTEYNIPIPQQTLGIRHLSVSVLGLDVVGEGLGLLDFGGVVVVVVLLRANVLHLVDAATLGASLNGALTGNLLSSNMVSYGSVCPD